jgi:xylulokinase
MSTPLSGERFLIGHDAGTQGSKSVLIDLGGGLLASTFQPYPVSYPEANRAEQDPDAWWRAVAEGTRIVVEESGVDPSEVAGMGFAGQMIGVVPVADSGEVLRPAIIWLDSRADRQAERMVRKLGGKKIFAMLAGAVATGKDVVCKLAWLRENEPDIYLRTAAFLDTTGYLVMKATGRKVMDHTGAAGTGLLTGSRKWSGLLARLTGVSLEKMPELACSIDVVGGLSGGASREMGLAEGTPVIAGMADIPAAATGSGALGNGEGHVYLGTSSWLCLSLEKPVNVPRLGMVSVASADPEMHILLGESETAGICLKWFAENLASAQEREGAGGDDVIFGVLDRVAAEVEPGSGGLIFAPWMYGERSPVPDTTLRGAYANLSLDHSREQMLRAIYEGVAFNLRWMMDGVSGRGLDLPSVRAIGGGAKSDVWMQVLADATGRRVEAVENPQEAGAVGCALAVAVGLGILKRYADIKEVVGVRETFEPDRELTPLYERLYEGFRCLYPGVSRACRGLNEEEGY